MKVTDTALLVAGSALISRVIAADRHFTWNLTYSTLPGTTDKEVILINNRWPPETIEVDVNDRIILTVNNDAKNGVKEGVSLHAHGFHQFNNNAEDGSTGVTQCSIPMGSSQTYTWPTSQTGTFWVHSHKIGQYPLGLRSPLIVKSKDESAFYGYDPKHDFVMDVSDNWSLSMADIEAKFKTGACCVSGRGNDVCGLEVPPDGAVVRDDLSGTTTYNAKSLGSGKARVRIVNMSAGSQFLVFSNDPDIEMEVIEVDGVPLKKNLSKAKSLELHPGQRYSVLVSNPRSFLLHAVIDPRQYSINSCQELRTIEGSSESNSGVGQRIRQAGGGSGSGTIQYNYALIATAKFDLGSEIPTSFFKPDIYCTDSNKPCYTTQSGLNNLPSHATDLSYRLTDDWEINGKLLPQDEQPRVLYGNDDDSVIITLRLTAQQGQNKFGNLNNGVFMEPQIPILLRQNQPDPTACSSAQLVPKPGMGQSLEQYYGANNTWNVRKGTNVFLVVQSAPGAHPFHLHGYDFQVLYRETGQNGQNRQSVAGLPDEQKIKDNAYNMPSLPLRRDTSWIGQGSYAIFAMKADNPGAWFLHCHNDFHSMTGMVGTLVVDSPDTADWNGKKTGQSVWNQCRFKTKSGGGFSDWTKQCCSSAESCSAGPDVVVA
ncbi:multicopper oxidase-domain-containing protein [Pseudomassariella vexata]|uniref:Multicopper oxidase-domain-containing protein n=1 Tax=Pseudomassariella vexata TaxID=1141098 RepID=A0A1Y2DP57_9PEZI|nr:multicopper oxidase-domain-containing protein [Pseudomassariella vexata]ORY60987.1 multicopper oxidase-domain-containing protein [Pseudomassariella vexata]